MKRVKKNKQVSFYEVRNQEKLPYTDIDNKKLTVMPGTFDDDKNLTDIYLEIAGVIIIVLDKRGNVVLINKKGCDVLGLERSSIIGKNWFKNFIPQHSFHKIFINFKKLMNGKVPEKFFENNIINKNGEERLIYWHSSTIKDNKGNIKGLISSGEDITENRKLQNDIIAQSNNSDFLYVLSRTVSDSVNLKDLISKAAKLLTEFPGMLGGIICIGNNNEIMECNEVVAFGAFKKILKNEEIFINNKFKKSIASGNLLEIENLYYDHYGSVRKVSACAYKMKTKTESHGIFIVITDHMDSTLNNFFLLVAAELGRAISRKKTEIAQKLSEEKFLSIFNTSPDAIAITELEDGYFLEVNKSFEELTGYKKEEVLKKRVDDIGTWLHPELRLGLIKRVKTEKKVVGFETSIRKKNGLIWNALISASLINFNGIKSMLTVVKDVSERVRNENEVKRTKQLLERITYTTPSFICLYDVNSDKILYSNKSILGSLGYSESDLEVFKKFGKSHKKSFYHPDDVDKIEEFEKKMKELHESDIVKIEYRLKDACSNWQWFQQTATVFQKSDNGKEILTINVFENITDRKQAEDAIKKHSHEAELLYQAGKAISGTLNLYEIYDRMYNIISEVADCKELIVTLYDPVKQLIYYKYLKAKATNNRVDVSNIPPIPLAPRGYGIVSEVIRTGKSVIIDDYEQYFQKVKTRYVISEKGEINDKEKKGTEAPKSALVIPIKLEDKILGAVQIFSAKYKAYNSEQLRFVESLMHQVALANKNAMVFEQAQNEIRERKIAQENLKISERNLRQFAESVPDVIYRLNYETGKYDFLSPVIVNILGYEMQEILNDPAGFTNKVIHPDDADFIKKSLMNHVKFGKVNHPLSIECRMIKKDGGIVWVRDSIMFEYKHGKINAAIGAMSDITEKKLEEENRRKRDERIIRYQSALLELSKLHSKDFDANIRKISEITAVALGIARTGIWLFNRDKTSLDCINRYYTSDFHHENGIKLPVKEYSNLINVLKCDEKISFSNTIKDENLKGFGENFMLKGVACSSLITRIHFHGDIAGFICIESAEAGKTEWSPEEYDFAVSVAGFISLILESEERFRAENEIKKSLKDKELLLREIHHRVKNNLQVISSLLYLQSKKLNDVKLNNVLLESQNRVKSMVMIHEKLYKSEDLASFNYAEYIKELSNSLFRSYNLDSGKISLEMHIGNIILDTDTAVHCGLIINELVSNSIKYAFPENSEGVISINFYSENKGDFILIVGDNGVGLPKDFNPEKSDTLGMMLIKILIEQINGTMDIQNNNGVTFTFKFSLNKKSNFYEKSQNSRC